MPGVDPSRITCQQLLRSMNTLIDNEGAIDECVVNLNLCQARADPMTDLVKSLGNLSGRALPRRVAGRLAAQYSNA